MAVKYDILLSRLREAEEGIPGQPGAPGKDGKNGVTFTPSVSEDGQLTWTNDGNLDNPEEVNLKGEPGRDGAKGEPGEPGPANVLAIGEVTFVESTENGEVTIEGESPNQKLTFKIPKGEKGADGQPGAAGADGKDAGFGTITATAESTDSETPEVTVTENGTAQSKNLTFAFKIPKGAKGEDGAAGQDGAQGPAGQDGKDAKIGNVTVKITPVETEAEATGSAEVKDNESGTQDIAFTLQLPKGDKGDPGAAGERGPAGENGQPGKDAQIGTVDAEVEMADPQTEAKVEVTPGEESEAGKTFHFKFTLPKGEKGEQGEAGTPGTPGAEGAKGADGEPGKDGESAGFGTPEVEVETVESTENAAVTVEPTTESPDTAKVFKFHFKIPKGATGERGEAGPAGPAGPTGEAGANGEKGDTGAAAGFGEPTIEVTTGTEGTDATATVTAEGEDTAKVFKFNFTIPRGEKGETGEKGEKGADGTVAFSDLTDEQRNSLKGQDGTVSFEELTPEQIEQLKGDPGETGPEGPPGKDGAAGEAGAPGEAAGFGTQKVEVTTLNPEDSATVEITPDDNSPNSAKVFTFKFGIPKGAQGDKGADGTSGEFSGEITSDKITDFDEKLDAALDEKVSALKSQFAESEHTHTTSDITDLDTQLNSKLESKLAALDSKFAAAKHTHTPAEINGLIEEGKIASQYLPEASNIEIDESRLLPKNPKDGDLAIFTVASSTGNNSNTKILLHCDSEEFADSAKGNESPATVTKEGSVTLDSTNFKFGNGSAKFPGNEANLKITAPKELMQKSPWMADCWFKVDSNNWTDWRRIFTQDNDQNGGWAYCLGKNNTVVLWVREVSGETLYSHGLAPEDWHHAALVYYKNNFYAYIDGQRFAQSVAKPDAFLDYIMLGRRINQTGYSLVGNIDEFRLQILDEAEINKWIGATIPVPTAAYADADTETVSKSWTLINKSELGGGAAAKPDHLVLIRPRSARGVFPVVKAYANATNFENGGQDVCSKDSHDKVKFWNGESLLSCSESGIPAACEGLPVDIDISSLELKSGYFVYSWEDSDGNASDSLVLPFPSVVEPTPFTTNALAASQSGLKIRTISQRDYSMLRENEDPFTLYFVEGQGLIFNGVKYFAEQTTQAEVAK